MREWSQRCSSSPSPATVCMRTQDHRRASFRCQCSVPHAPNMLCACLSMHAAHMQHASTAHPMMCAMHMHHTCIMKAPHAASHVHHASTKHAPHMHTRTMQHASCMHHIADVGCEPIYCIMCCRSKSVQHHTARLCPEGLPSGRFAVGTRNVPKLASH